MIHISIYGKNDLMVTNLNKKLKKNNFDPFSGFKWIKMESDSASKWAGYNCVFLFVAIQGKY